MEIIKDEPSKEASGGNISINVSNEELVGAGSQKSSEIIKRDQPALQNIEEKLSNLSGRGNRR